jgi:sigma-B regulation protein RsbU (phosphoserine phosphatase)
MKGRDMRRKSASVRIGGQGEEWAGYYTQTPLEEIKKRCILVADDVEFNLMMFCDMFRSCGFHNLHTARNGVEALEKTRLLKPDLVVLDLIMPRLDGFGYMEEVRQDKAFADMPILVLTCAGGEEEKRKVFKNGGADFVCKPAEKFELMARALVHLDRRMMIRQLRASAERVEQELEQARAMQEIILPKREEIEGIERDYGVSLSSLFRSSSELGGDFWGAQRIDADRFGLYLADFSGHGVAAALNTFRLHTLAGQPDGARSDPALYLAKLNASLCELLPAGQFATMLYAAYDRRDRTLRYASAGAPLPILVRKEGEAEILQTEGLPLGARKEAAYAAGSAALREGDTFFLYSDALIETPAFGATGERSPYSEREIADRLCALRRAVPDAEEYAWRLRAEMLSIYERDFFGFLLDDLTMAAVTAG